MILNGVLTLAKMQSPWDYYRQDVRIFGVHIGDFVIGNIYVLPVWRLFYYVLSQRSTLNVDKVIVDGRLAVHKSISG